MNVFEKAAWILTPNGFKAPTLYGVKGTDFGYTRNNTGSTRINSAGVLEELAANVPRIDWTKGFPEIFLERSSRNDLVRSSEFTSVNWVKEDVTAEDNNIAAYNGLIRAGKITNSVGTGSELRQNVNITVNSTNTFSVFAKFGNTTWFKISMARQNQAGNAVNAWFNLVSGTVGTVSNAGTGTGATASIEDWGNGWYRCILTGAVNDGVSVIEAYTRLTNADNSSSTTAGLFYYLDAAQLQPGSSAQNPVPTTSTAVTTVNEIVSKSGVSSLIGQTEGTLVLQYTADRQPINGCVLLYVGDASSDNSVSIFMNAAGMLQGTVTTNGVSLSMPRADSFGTHKVVYTYKSGDRKLFFDGAEVIASSSSFAFGAVLDRICVANRNGALWGDLRTRLTMGFTERLPDEICKLLSTP